MRDCYFRHNESAIQPEAAGCLLSPRAAAGVLHAPTSPVPKAFWARVPGEATLDPTFYRDFFLPFR